MCIFIFNGPIIVMIIEKENAVLANRELMGATNPEDAKDDTIKKKIFIFIIINFFLFYIFCSTTFNR